MKKAILFEKTGGMVRCTACSHYCIIPKNRTGLCGVRKNINGDLFLLVYGMSTGLNIDPIEKKPLFHFLPGTEILSFGTVGCNFGCEFCQNWRSSQITRTIRQESKTSEEHEIRLKEIDYMQIESPPEKIIKEAVKNNVPSIAFTYNEPAIFFEYAYDTAKLAKKKDIRTVFVSNGYETKEAISEIKPYLDAFNIDIKSFSEDFYRKICRARLQPVLDNVKRVWEEGFWLEVTTLIIPGQNDSEAELKKIAEYIAGISKEIPWHVTAFYPAYKMLGSPPTHLNTLLKAYRIGKEANLKYMYIGNTSSPEHESTFCPGCNNILIERSGYFTRVTGMKNGKCGGCEEKIAGVWK